MSRLQKLIAEIHRRSLWQVLGIYLLGAWFMYQVILALTDGIGLPDWVPAFAFILFLIGLPIVVATAFVNEGPPSRDALRRRSLDDIPLTLLEPDAQVSGQGAPDAGRAELGVSTESAHWLTWRRSLAAGFVAFVVLGAGTTGFMGMRIMGVGPVGTLIARGVIASDDGVVLADFSSSTGAVPGSVVAEALRIDLQQTTAFRLADPAHVRDVLRLMQHDPATGLPADVARELAQREGLKAVLTGDVSMLGGSYIITARLLAAADGSELAAFKTTARDSTQLIDAVDALSKQIRSRVGESLRTVRASEPLWQLSTSSLPALRKYTESVRVQITEGDDLRTIALLEEAIEIDSMFAGAYRKLAVSLGNLGVRRSDQLKAMTRAYELRDRLPERERLNTIGSYHSSVTRDDARAAEAYRDVLALDPQDFVATNNLALALGRERRFDEAAAILEHATQHGASGSFHFTNLAIYQVASGRIEDAASTVAEAIRRMPANTNIRRFEARLAGIRGDYDAADSTAVAFLSNMPTGTNTPPQILLDRVDYALVRGRLRQHDDLLAELRLMAEEAGLRPQMLAAALRPVQARMRLLGSSGRAARDIERLLQEHPLQDMEPVDRPYLNLAQTFARTDDFARARTFLAAYEAEVPLEDRLDPTPFARLQAWLRLREQPSREALNELRRFDRSSCEICDLPDIGMGFESIGEPDSAIAVYRRFVETPSLMRIGVDAWSLPLVLERLGDMHEQRGEMDLALSYYGRLLELWKDADAELQPRVQTIRNRVETITSRRG